MTGDKNNMEYSFPHYLLSKQSVDDRALNRVVLDALRANLPIEPIRIIEVGAGIGTMLKRLVRWDIILKAEVVLVDEMAEKLKAIAKNGVDEQIFVRGDKGINYGTVMKVMGRISAGGFKKVSLVTDVEDGS